MASPRDGALVRVNGVGFATDPSQISWRTIPIGRQGVDQGAGPGETALSNEVIWRRTQENWVEGAGQDYFDLIDESSRLRFRSSTNVDSWTTRSLRLLHTTDQKLSSANTNLKLAAAAAGGTSYLVAIDGTAVKRTSNPTAGTPTFTNYTGTSGLTYTDITTDGTTVWVADGGGVDKALVSASAVATFSNEPTSIVGYANGRLLGAFNNELFELDSTGTRQDLFEHPSTAFVWDGIIPSPAGIYCFGHLGDNSEVYVVTAVDGTGALDVPFHAGALPDGELLRTLVFYAGVMVLGTSKGLRLAVITGGGFLSFGPAIDEPGDVRCLEPQGEDVWFGWNYDGTVSSGLGRARLSRFTSDLVPAFARDLQPTSVLTGATTSVVTVADRRYFVVSGSGVWGEESTYATSGTIDLGWFTYGIPEHKMLDGAQVWTDALNANEAVAVAVYPDTSAVAILSGTHDTDAAETKNLAPSTQTAAERYRVVLTLTGPGSTSPIVRRLTLRSVPAPFVAQEITLPLVLEDTAASDTAGVDYGMDAWAEWQALEVLLLARTRFTLAVGSWSRTARLEALEVVPGGLGGGNDIEGWDDRQQFLAGKWKATFVTVQT